VALLWILLWVYVPDLSPNAFSFTDLLRGLFLVFSFMAFGFALLLLLIRFKGIDIASNFIPYSGIVLWLGKHAFEYSQPKTTLICHYSGQHDAIILNIKHHQYHTETTLENNSTQTIELGYITSDPMLLWLENQIRLDLKKHLKTIGKNLKVHVSLSNHNCEYKIE
jgi:hypothetical protein